MSRRLLCLAAASAAVSITGAPMALAQTGPQPDSVTATGTGQARVLPSNRHNNASIAAAYAAAEKRAIKGAVAAAHDDAAAYAAAGGLTLGSIESISDSGGNFYYGPGPLFGPFGPGRFCGTIPQPVFRKVDGRRRIVRFRHVHRCIVPRYAFLTLTVTYAASPTTTTTQTSTTQTSTTTTTTPSTTTTTTSATP